MFVIFVIYVTDDGNHMCMYGYLKQICMTTSELLLSTCN